MNYISRIGLLIVGSIMLSFSILAAELEGIAVIDVEAAILSTEVSKQAFEELSNSKEWKEVSEGFQLKVNEAQEIAQNVQKDGTTMSDEEKLESQKRLRSLEQDANFMNQKLQQMRNELIQGLQQEQAPKVQKVLTELMRAKGIKILLQRSAVLGWDQGDPSLNITPEVVELLNQKEE